MKSTYESARRQTQRIALLRNRMKWIHKKWGITPANSHLAQELSALEWAISVLEAYMTATYGSLLPERGLWGRDRKRVVEALRKRDGHICYLCNKPMLRNDMTVDHVIPLVKNGADNMSNYKLTHELCNVQKGNMLLEVFREWQIGKRKERVES